MNTKITINRAAFVDFMGCLLARWERDSIDLIIDAAWYQNIELGTMITKVLPDEPGKVYGKSVWEDILKKRKVILKRFANKKTSSIMVSYRTCSNIAKCLGVDSQRHWGRLADENPAQLGLPIPKSPNKLYQKNNGGWSTWFAFLGKEVPREFLSYTDARALVHKLEIGNVEEFRAYVRSGIASPRMPKRPDHVYADEWQGWPKFLPPRFLSYEEAVEVMSNFHLKTESDFHMLGSLGERPEGIPSHPSVYYRDKWQGWKKFLSVNSINNNSINWTA